MLMLPYVVTIFAVAGLVGRVARPGRRPASRTSSHERVETDIDWDAAARRRERRPSMHAYVPYSQFPVGAAALVDDGRDRLRLQRRERVVRADPVRRVRAWCRACT